MKQRVFISSIVGLAVLLSGCVNLKAPPDPTRYYLLNGSADIDALAENPIGSAPIVRLDPIEVDPYLDTPYMVLRVQQYEVQFSDIHRWGENLTDNIWRALARDMLATGKVSDVVQTYDEKADYVISVHVHRFEGKPPDIAHLQATWELKDSRGRVLFSTWHDDLNHGWSFQNYGHLAEKLDESLQTLAEAMAAKLP